MLRGTLLVILSVATLGACGTSTADRTLSAGGIGAAGALVLGANPLAGAVVGGVAGAVTNPDDINLGTPFWRRGF
jgi:osmotically inducible lipoprotein OsmB